MTRLNYNRHNAGYELEPWRRPIVETKKRALKTVSRTQTILQETHFISGKYQGKHIGTTILKDPGYILWVIDNQPRSITAQQIMAHYNRQANPAS